MSRHALLKSRVDASSAVVNVENRLQPYIEQLSRRPVFLFFGGAIDMFQQQTNQHGKPVVHAGGAQRGGFGTEIIDNDPSRLLSVLLESTSAIGSNLDVGDTVTDRELPANFVLDRDGMGRPTVWKIGALVRQISYLPSGKINQIEETGQLPPLATSNGKPAYLLSFGTHDGGRTYIGRFRSENDIEPIVMTKLDLRGDGTIVTADDSGLELSWNPNSGESTASLSHRHGHHEAWIDHLDGTVSAELKFKNGLVVLLHGRQETEFDPTKPKHTQHRHMLEISEGISEGISERISEVNSEVISESTSGKNAQVIATDSQGNKTKSFLDISLLELSRLLVQGCSVDVDWHRLEAPARSITIIDSCNGEAIRVALKD